MINAKSLAAIQKTRWTPYFNRPLYKDYAFSCLPGTIEKLLTTAGKQTLSADAVGGKFEKFDCAILFLIDGFGWKFFEEYFSRLPFLKRFEKEGVASKISSQFPSTTAAHITSINTGLDVAQTGIYEWFYYEPLIDRMIAPLLFSYAGDHQSGTLLSDGFTPQQIFPFETIYQKLAKKGVRSFVLQHEGIAHSPYSKAMLEGANIVPYRDFPKALDTLVELCSKPFAQPTYIFVYHGDIDSAGHRHGIVSSEFEEEIVCCWTQIENRFWKKLASCPNKTAVMCTADHGMTSVHPKTTILLNKICPELEKMVKKNKNGLPLVPAGSCRDFFMHIEDKYLKKAQSLIAQRLEGIADVVLVQELLDGKFFGRLPPSKRLKERVGNLVVLPYRNESVFWWFEKHRLEQHFYGAHGGLTPDEMESIFLFCQTGNKKP